MLTNTNNTSTNQTESYTTFLDLLNNAASEVKTESKRKKHTVLAGDIIQTKNGTVEVLEYINAKEVRIKFIETGYETTVQAVRLRDGKVKDRLQPTEYGGYLGNATSTDDTGKLKQPYVAWCKMLERVNTRLNYSNVTVCDEFKCFESYELWYRPRLARYKEGTAGLSVDSDIASMCAGVEKQYSPETCILIPRHINSAFARAVESLDAFANDTSNGIKEGRNGEFIVLTHGDKSRHEDYEQAELYAIDLLISVFMTKFNVEVLPFLNTADKKKVSSLNRVLRMKYLGITKAI